MTDPDFSDSDEFDDSWMSNPPTFSKQKQTAKRQRDLAGSPSKTQSSLKTPKTSQGPSFKSLVVQLTPETSQRPSSKYLVVELTSKTSQKPSSHSLVVQRDAAFGIITDADTAFTKNILTQFGYLWDDKQGLFERSMHYDLPYDFTRITDPLMRLKNFLAEQSKFEFTLDHELKSGEVVSRWNVLDSLYFDHTMTPSQKKLVQKYKDFLSLDTVKRFVEILTAYKGKSVIIQMACTTLVAMNFIASIQLAKEDMKFIPSLQLTAAKKAINEFMTQYRYYLSDISPPREEDSDSE
jgi:hypothetical protein